MRKHDPHDLMLGLGLHATRARPRRRTLQLAAGAVALASLGWALPDARRADTEGSALVEVLAGGRRAADLRTIPERTQARLVFSKNLAEQLAIGDPEVLQVEVLNEREILLLGKTVGTTTLTVWYADETLEQLVFTVSRDISILQAALHEVHPAISATIATDRDALVLTGNVPERRLAVEAQKVAANYLEAGEAQQTRIINLIRSEGDVHDIADVIRNAIRNELGYERVTVSRVVQVEGVGGADILLLGGSVKDQVQLIRTLTLASRIFLQNDLVERRARNEYEETTQVLPSGESRTTRRPLQLEDADEDIRVAADESGALFFDDSGGDEDDRGLGSSARLLRNRIDSNLGRSKAIELAGGRILAFVEVEDQVQVRVDVRFLEVDRNKMLDWDSASMLEVRDYGRPSRFRPENWVGDPGVSAPTAGAETDNADFRNILSFLGGAFTEQFGISGDHVDLEAIFSVLETEGLVRTLSRPSLTVLSGELAEFNTGGRIPIDETFFAGTSIAQSSVTFVEFGVKLAVRPLVDEDDYVVLDLVPELTDPDPQLTEQILISSGTNPPTTAFSQRGLRTTTRLRDGESLLIGGLAEHSRRDDSGHTPWLHELPLLGWLFKDFSYEDSDRDLVIVVNPSIVRDRPELSGLWVYPVAGEAPREPQVAAHAPSAPSTAAAAGGGAR